MGGAKKANKRLQLAYLTFEFLFGSFTLVAIGILARLLSAGIQTYYEVLLEASSWVFGIFGALMVLNSLISAAKLLSKKEKILDNGKFSTKKKPFEKHQLPIKEKGPSEQNNNAAQKETLEQLSLAEQNDSKRAIAFGVGVSLMVVLGVMLGRAFNAMREEEIVLRQASGDDLFFVLICLLAGSSILSLFIVLQWIIPFLKNRAKTREFAGKLTAVSSTKFRAIAFIAIIAFTGIGYPVVYNLMEPKCNPRPLGFNRPSYSLEEVQNNPHHNHHLDNETLINQTVLGTLEKSLWAMTKVQSAGGFPMYSLADGSERYGDTGAGFELCNYYPREFSLQGGTQLVGYSYLKMYQLEPNPVYLKVATDAAEALVAVQNDNNGGFEYNGRRFADGTGYPGSILILDDDVTQGNLRFLMDVYAETGNETYKIAALKGLDGILAIEIPGGGFPQRTGYEPDDYQSYVTLNDDALYDLVLLLLKGYNTFGEVKYLHAAQRAGQFLIRVQGNGGSEIQQGWAQQYKDDMPAWARRMEPPSMCSKQTGSAIEILMELYLATGNRTYLEPIPDAISWLTHPTTLVEKLDDPGSYYWSRLYELETNKMIVGNRNDPDGPEYYYDYDEERDYGYSWLGTYGINSTLEKYDYLVSLEYNASQYVEWISVEPSSASYLSKVYSAVDTLTEEGFWLTQKEGEEVIHDSLFTGNAHSMIAYLGSVIRR